MSCPSCSCQAHHLQEHKSTSSSEEPICTPRVSTAGAWPLPAWPCHTHSPQSPWHRQEHVIAATTRPRGRQPQPEPREQAEQCLHPTSGTVQEEEAQGSGWSSSSARKQEQYK